MHVYTHCMFPQTTRMHTQYPLNADDYKDLLSEFKAIVEAHQRSIGTLPPAELDPIDLSAKNAPCCSHATHCTCSQNGTFSLTHTHWPNLKELEASSKL